MTRISKIPDLAAFEGHWQIDRMIEDRRAGQTGRFTGTGLFRPDAGGLIYEERGRLTLGAARFEAERRYFWRVGDGGIDVCFEDGRFFHRIGPKAVHWCDPDDYHVTYDFGDWPRWQAAWQVTGPRKDYVMTSIYRPASQRQTISS